MDYRIELQNPSDFEKMINTICQNVLGMGVITFSEGKDGGRDGKFTGTANKFPSEKEQWSGKFIIQAKHTVDYSASCSDTKFEALIDLEIKKLKALKATGDVDNYLLFTNRKYSAVVGERLCKKIIAETGINNAQIIGKEHINNHYLNPNKEIIKQYGLDKHHIPFEFSDEDIKELILVFKSQLPMIEEEIKTKVEEIKYDFDRIKIEEKNKLNRLGEAYFINEIQSRSLMDFDKIHSFLNNPINEELKEIYFDVAAELSQIIILKRDNFDLFEEIFVFIYQLICDGSVILKGGKRHITTLLHFMYFECLIGRKND